MPELHVLLELVPMKGTFRGPLAPLPALMICNRHSRHGFTQGALSLGSIISDTGSLWERSIPVQSAFPMRPTRVRQLFRQRHAVQTRTGLCDSPYCQSAKPKKENDKAGQLSPRIQTSFAQITSKTHRHRNAYVREELLFSCIHPQISSSPPPLIFPYPCAFDVSGRVFLPKERDTLLNR